MRSLLLRLFVILARKLDFSFVSLYAPRDNNVLAIFFARDECCFRRAIDEYVNASTNEKPGEKG